MGAADPFSGEESDMTDPTAQGQSIEQNTDEAQEKDTGPTAEEVQAAFEKRVAAQSAKMRELEAQLAETRQMNAQLVQTVQVARNPPAPEPELDIDPEEMKRINYLVAKATGPLNKKIAELEREQTYHRMTADQAEIQAKIRKASNPRLEARVQEIMANCARDPNLRGATIRDAYLIARGEEADGLLDQQEVSRNTRRDFNEAAPQPLTGHAGSRRAGGGGGVPVEQRLAEADLNDMDPDQLDELINAVQKKHPKGFSL